MANNFKFNLEKVLDIRRQKEEESVRIFQEAQREKIKLENKLDDFKNNYDKYNGIKSNETVVYQKLKRIYVQNLTKAMDEVEWQLEKKEVDINIKRQHVKQKQIERKTVETLKEKKYQAFIKEQDRIERIFNDEMALYGHFRKLERR